MGDGPVANLPAGLDAYAGYDDESGIGETWPAIQELPAKYHLSISTVAGVAAMCGDVESGALSSWRGYTVGYCPVSSVNALVAAYGRPAKLWTAHRDPALGQHICSPACWPGLVTTADGTQWSNHGGAWDESVLSDDFFDFLAPTPLAAPIPGGTMLATDPETGGYWYVDDRDGHVEAYSGYSGGPVPPYPGGLNTLSPNPITTVGPVVGATASKDASGNWGLVIACQRAGTNPPAGDGAGQSVALYSFPRPT
jgi:hypothetical protein